MTFTLEHKSKISKSLKEYNFSHPESNNNKSKILKKRFNTPEIKTQRSKLAKKTWNDPKIREKRVNAIKVAHAKLEYKNKMELIGKERCSNPETRKKMSGPNSGNWKGGISFKPYCIKFNDQLKDEVRGAFGKKCYLCPHVQGERKLSIHHVDYNKNTLCDGRRWPLIPLCSKCHSKTNFNRWYWFNLLMNYWALNPEINLDRNLFNL